METLRKAVAVVAIFSVSHASAAPVLRSPVGKVATGFQPSVTASVPRLTAPALGAMDAAILGLGTLPIADNITTLPIAEIIPVIPVEKNTTAVRAPQSRKEAVKQFVKKTARVQAAFANEAKKESTPNAQAKAGSAVMFDFSRKGSVFNGADPVDGGGYDVESLPRLTPYKSKPKVFPAGANVLSVPVAVEKKAAKKKESRRFFKRWKMWVTIGVVLVASAFGAYKYFGPRLDQISPPDAVVIVDKSPYEMTEDVSASILQTKENPSIVLSGHEKPVRSFSIRADRKAAVSVDQEGSWKLWDLETGKVYTPKNYPGKVRTALFANEGRKLILVDEDGTVRVSTLRTGEVQTIGRDLESVRFDAISPDAQRVTLGTSDNKVHVLELGTAKPTAFAVGGKILAVGSTQAGDMVLTTSKGIVKLWKIEPGKAPAVVIEKYIPGLKIKGSSLSKSCDRLLALSEMAGDQIVLAWQFGANDVQMIMGYDFAGEDATLASVASTPDGTTVAILGTDGRLWKWTPGQGEPVLIGKADSGSKVFFSKSGTTVWTADKSGRLQAWIVPVPAPK